MSSAVQKGFRASGLSSGRLADHDNLYVVEADSFVKMFWKGDNFHVLGFLSSKTVKKWFVVVVLSLSRLGFGSMALVVTLHLFDFINNEESRTESVPHQPRSNLNRVSSDYVVPTGSVIGTEKWPKLTSLTHMHNHEPQGYMMA